MASALHEKWYIVERNDKKSIAFFPLPDYQINPVDVPIKNDLKKLPMIRI